MAHGDYNCCACCDTKMAYSSDATTKEDLCIDCMRSLHSFGVMVYDGFDLLKWMKDSSISSAEKLMILRKAGFAMCHYGNPVDEEYAWLKSDEPTTPRPQNWAQFASEMGEKIHAFIDSRGPSYVSDVITALDTGDPEYRVSSLMWEMIGPRVGGGSYSLEMRTDSRIVRREEKDEQ